METRVNFMKYLRRTILLGTSLILFGLASTNTVSVKADSSITSTTISAPNISDQTYYHSSATQLAKMVRSGKVTPQQLIEHAVAKIKADNPQLNAVISLREDQAMKEAANLKDTGQPFYGVPLLIKGLGQPIVGSSNTRGLVPLADQKATTTSSFVQRLQSMGFIVIGQTNFPELGLINITNSALNGVAHNPWNHADNTGGSSGGAVASVADDIVPVATGNDAGGSLRIPASWTGVIGLKPTQGVIEGDDTTPSSVNFADAKNIQDMQTLFNGMLATSDHSGDAMLKSVPKNIKKIPIAYSTKSPVNTPVSKDAVNAVKQAVSFLRSKGFKVVKANSPVDGVKLMHIYYLESTGTGTSANNLIKSVTGKNMTFDDVSPMTWALYQADQKQPANADTTVQNELNLVNRQMTAFHKKYPLYLTPTTAVTAPKNTDPAYLPQYVDKLRDIGNLDHNQQIQTIYDAWLHGLTKTPFTQLANLSGEPAISLPTYVSKQKMPLGIQFEAAKGNDKLLLKVGAYFQDNHKFKMLDNYR
ncbi:amidase family protein [Lentilactobacillus buchneri]|uniref:Amidase n=1 Tax=Lentilactobacillus buchneri subsp. silagei CD034 TaxID=1071400 RepID=J9W2G8_LENBU|nr:amidase family protein [Lentilactobacillus buchneri]MCC6100717.1 cell wall anchor protein [Lactobacillus sp.]AFR99224.1 amidase [Lentilactobacillus buchneri subsp. silagei CD034]MCT2900663.1 cell wall anchor protein [Lentilactobacillus buchneri]MCT3542549.1 cell wall anchor protein [Lentilactobacillus buchneri]MCT3552606.1 cell wall anchor protein [Lentilactobacillus buchneri]